jgi:hypothetical protein
VSVIYSLIPSRSRFSVRGFLIEECCDTQLKDDSMPGAGFLILKLLESAHSNAYTTYHGTNS